MTPPPHEAESIEIRTDSCNWKKSHLTPHASGRMLGGFLRIPIGRPAKQGLSGKVAHL